MRDGVRTVLQKVWKALEAIISNGSQVPRAW